MVLTLLPVLSETSSAAGESWLWPAETCNQIQSNFGMRDLDRNGTFESFHSGIDINRTDGRQFGEPVRAAKSGTVIYLNNTLGDYEDAPSYDPTGMLSYGNAVGIDHGDGTRSIYAHMRNNIPVSYGQYVTQGQLIGYIGDSGNSGAPHLHFQISLVGGNWSGSAYVRNTMPTVETINALGLHVVNEYRPASGYDTVRTTYINSYNPTVCVDSCVGGEGTVYLRGWAFDKDDYSLPVMLHVYVGGPDHTTGVGYQVLANTYRPDVNDVYGCGENHGFETTLDVSVFGDNVDVYVYGINSIGGGTNFLKEKYTVKITVPPPGKPEWKDMKSSYEYDEDVIFNWTNTENTTHFGVNIYNADTGALIRYIYNIPMGYSYELPAGNYKAQVIAFNENAYESDGTTLKHTESDFCYFTVETETGKMVTYTARYYMQKANGKGYVLSDQKVLDGISGETATAPVVSYDGFTENTAKGTVSGTIAKDGSLVLSRYFDRNTYSIKFEMNGGSTTSTIKALYEAPVTAPDEPSKEGYDFGGWYADEDFEEEFVFNTMPLGGAKVYAKWDLRGIEYQINGIILKSSSTYEVIDSIPDSSFLVEVSVTNVCADDTDAVILAYYKENGQYIGMQYLYTKSQAGQTMRFGASVDNTKGEIAKIKAFVLPTLGSPIPLANSAEVK